jgi:hypothetical protein
MSIRRSNVALVAIKLRVGDDQCLLFHRHRKWGDWSLVGGHVEHGEERDWLLTGTRESEEELEPLKNSVDFHVEKWLTDPIEWGPVASRSARNLRTIYRVTYFKLRFLVDPCRALERVRAATELMLIGVDDMNAAHEFTFSDTFSRLRTKLPNGASDIPLSWQDTIPAAEIRVPLFVGRSSRPGVYTPPHLAARR